MVLLDVTRVRNVRRSPAVSLALDSADGGQDIVLADGRAAFPADADPRLWLLTGTFQEKYARALGSTPFEQWHSTFSQAVLVRVERITAWTRTATGVAYRTVPSS